MAKVQALLRRLGLLLCLSPEEKVLMLQDRLDDSFVLHVYGRRCFQDQNRGFVCPRGKAVGPFQNFFRSWRVGEVT